METEKNSRMLELFFRVLRGETISVKAVAAEYGVSTKSIGRDIGSRRNWCIPIKIKRIT